VVDETSYAVLLHQLLERWHKRCELPEIVNLFEPVWAKAECMPLVCHAEAVVGQSARAVYCVAKDLN